MSGIFVLQGESDLVELEETAYDSEARLQDLLARFPSLIPGDQVDPDAPRKWLLVTREQGVPDQEGGSDRWSLDHLFLDQDGVPTLVEVKRSSDTRIRREVVGQMLDYAANAVVYWPVEAIQATFEARCEREEVDPDQLLESFLGEEADLEDFWHKVKINLQAGRVRLLFVADKIPSELRRVVEFLDQQMDPAQVLAVEVKQYQGQGLRSLIPRVIGQTEQARRRKTPGARRRDWDEPSFFEVLEARPDTSDVKVARALLEWGKKCAVRIGWGKGKKWGSFAPILEVAGTDFYPIRVWPGYRNAQVEIPFQAMKVPPFDTEDGRRSLLDRLNEISGVKLSSDSVAKFPNIPLHVLSSQATQAQFLSVLDWICEGVVEAGSDANGLEGDHGDI